MWSLPGARGARLESELEAKTAERGCSRSSCSRTSGLENKTPSASRSASWRTVRSVRRIADVWKSCADPHARGQGVQGRGPDRTSPGGDRRACQPNEARDREAQLREAHSALFAMCTERCSTSMAREALIEGSKGAGRQRTYNPQIAARTKHSDSYRQHGHSR